MKEKFKRAIKYIFFGIPKVDIRTQIVQISPSEQFLRKSIIVTGGSRGLGFSIAQKCIQEGAEVIITGRNVEKLIAAQNKLGEKCKYICYDSKDVEKVNDFIKQASDIFTNHRIDGLVNNAGISLHEGDFRNVTIESFDEQMNINLRGSYFLIKAYVYYLEKSSMQGNVVVVASERGIFCDDIPYGLSKNALISFAQAIAKRVAAKGIRINTVAPGLTATDLTGKKSSDNLVAYNQEAGRVFVPEEISEVVCFLLSDVSRCINGETIACNAGNSLNSYININKQNEEIFKSMTK